MFKRISLYLVFAIAIGSALDWWFKELAAPSVLYMMITILSGVIMGFTIGNLAVFVSIANVPIINNLKKTGHYANIIHNIYLTIAAMFATLLAGLCSLLIANHYIHWLTAVLCVFGLLNLFSTAIKFCKVIQLVSQPTGNPNILD